MYTNKITVLIYDNYGISVVRGTQCSDEQDYLERVAALHKPPMETPKEVYELEILV